MQYASLPISQLESWALLNNVELHGIKIEPAVVDQDGNAKGGGLVSTALHRQAEVLLIVPHDLVVSKSQITDCARIDARLRRLIDTLEGSDLIKTPRGIFLVFLLYQFTIVSAAQEIGGVQNAFTDYVRFLPKEIPLPTFYSREEREILEGTSLSEALGQKTQGLEKEFEMLRERTNGLGWARKAWWGLSLSEDEDDSQQVDSETLRFEDWKLMDAMYRSRALELPNDQGIVMVPVLDMVNHASDDRYNARFEADGDGNVMLVVRDGKTISTGDEVSIMYGCGGACEMIFSYGFLDNSTNSAREVFLGITIPSDDPLRLAKMRFSETAPGVRLYVDQMGQIGWDSDFVWWACVNEEDGLDFQVLQSVDGQKELKAVWKGREFEANELKTLLLADGLRDVFVLRSLVLLQQRVEQQGMRISDSEEMLVQAQHATGGTRSTWELISRLRNLELELLTAAFERLETEKAAMLNSEAVRRFLEAGVSPSKGAGEDEHDDFS